MTRRDFLKTTAVAAAGLTLADLRAEEAAQNAKTFSTRLLKAMIRGKADPADLEALAKAGFDGVEMSNKAVTVEEARQGRIMAEKAGLKIHSFMGGWANFNANDPAERQASIKDVERMIRIAGAYGASTILLVPCRIGGKMPRPSQFDIAFDPGTLKMTRAVKGDNAPFADYIAAQNLATERSIEAVKQLIPTAAAEGVTIALENVWNNLWVLPAFASAFIRSFNDPWVKAYLDLGNHVRYAPVEEWLTALEGITAKLHIKDFLIDRQKGNEGTFVPINKGSINWVSVRETIEKVRYNGWVTIESDGYTDAEHAVVMDTFFAGKLTH
ncbi:MAG: TIM barrel protein [Kiritimatiellae bacterium]|nr:TIM barrel protein [Kiritimatiellia bacterium]